MFTHIECILELEMAECSLIDKEFRSFFCIYLRICSVIICSSLIRINCCYFVPRTYLYCSAIMYSSCVYFFYVYNSYACIKISVHILNSFLFCYILYFCLLFILP